MGSLKIKTVFSFFVLLLGVCLIACSGPIPKKEDVKGKWVAVEKENYTLGGGQTVGFVIEFFDDYTMMLPSGKANWSIRKDGIIIIETPAMTMLGAIQGDKMTVTLPDEKGKVIFKKR